MQADSLGKLLQPSFTVWLKPLSGLIVTVRVTALPTATVMGVGVTVIEKLELLTTCTRMGETLPPSDMLPG